MRFFLALVFGLTLVSNPCFSAEETHQELLIRLRSNALNVIKKSLRASLAFAHTIKENMKQSETITACHRLGQLRILLLAPGYHQRYWESAKVVLLRDATRAQEGEYERLGQQIEALVVTLPPTFQLPLDQLATYCGVTNAELNNRLQEDAVIPVGGHERASAVLDLIIQRLTNATHNQSSRSSENFRDMARIDCFVFREKDACNSHPYCAWDPRANRCANAIAIQ